MTKSPLDQILKFAAIPYITPETTLLDGQQAADFLGIKVGTLAVWQSTKRYDLPSVKIGRLRKYRLSDLKAFVERNCDEGGPK
jgi:hypothetical protein